MADRKATILIVDDGCFAHRIIKGVLDSGGFQVLVMPEGKSVPETVKKLRPDLVLLDVIIPGLDPFSVCREIRGSQGGTLVPILMMMEREDTESIRLAFEAGATDFILKSMDPELLLHRVRYTIRGSRTIYELHASEARLKTLKQAIDCLPIGITITDVDGKILYTNPAEAEMHGYAEDHLETFHARNLAPSRLWNSSDTNECRKIGVWKRESVNVRKNGEEFPVYLCSHSITDHSGNPIGIVTSCEDITGRKEAEDRIHRLAFHDTLTGLPNRALCLERLNQALTMAKREGRKVGLLFLDLDNFKDINDSEGHDFGDIFLQEVAERLSGVVRESDTLSRLGGDELVIVLTSVDSQESIAAAAQRALSAFAAPFVIRERSIYSSVSIGIAVFPDDGADCETLFRCADAAMYVAKKDTTKFRFFSSEMNEMISRRVALINRLRDDQNRENFFLQYQPQWDIQTRTMTGVEALLRWQNPDYGLLSPLEFLPLVERTGDICSLGEWILLTACTQAAEWSAAGYPLKLAVNISGRQLKRAGFPELLEEILARTGLPPEQLELEFTESVLMQRKDVLETLRSLKKIGVRLAIDDFGTGYSSFSYLKNFAVDRLKVDRSFISEVNDNSDVAAIVEAIFMVAKKLKLEVVAEGVETEEQLRFLAARNCGAVQGFLFSAPLAPAEVLAHLHHGHATLSHVQAPPSSPFSFMRPHCIPTLATNS